MVSTRGVKYQFSEGEKVLCYEPDPTKAKVLYDSKVLEVFDTRDKRGRRVVEYLIHFQGWNSSWDRRVIESFVLKDNVANRQLQKDLAEKSQLCLGAYLYRRDRKKSTKRCSTDSPAEGCSSSSEVLTTTKLENDFTIPMADNDAESSSSSAESNPSQVDDEKVVIQVSKRLKDVLEYDNMMITKENRLCVLPAQRPVVTILEKFVKECSVKLICNHIRQEGRKRRNSATKTEKESVDTEKLTSKLNLYKEVADGLRIYFDFTLRDHLLYEQEQEQAIEVLSEESLNRFTYMPSNQFLGELIFPANEKLTPTTTTADLVDDHARRRLRSYKLEMDEEDIGATTTPFAATIAEILRSVQPLNTSVPYRYKVLLHTTLAWHMLPTSAPAEPSMIYGAPHLARLMIKLPEFLTHIIPGMPEDKLKYLLEYIGEFLEFFEGHTNWFGEDNYHTPTFIKMEIEEDIFQFVN
ncbi:Protein male-specific lethal-3 [Sergentomyia squamirostris]